MLVFALYLMNFLTKYVNTQIFTDNIYKISIYYTGNNSIYNTYGGKGKGNDPRLKF